MTKNILLIAFLILPGPGLLARDLHAKPAEKHFVKTCQEVILSADTIPPAEIMDLVSKVINALNKFNIDDVANLYTPNAVIADDEPPYSWNGPTAGIQWVNAVEQACKDNQVSKLRASIEPIHVYQQTTDNVYIVVPVTFTGDLHGRPRFNVKGGFTFVLRMENGKWLIKSQVWMPRTGM